MIVVAQELNQIICVGLLTSRNYNFARYGVLDIMLVQNVVDIKVTDLG